MNKEEKYGKLHLIPSFMGEENSSLICENTKTIISELDEFIVETAKSARRFLRAVGYKKNFDTEVTMHELDKHADKQDCIRLMANVLHGKNCGLISDAGNPCIADPGGEIVAYAHKNNVTIVPHVGPSSILLALISSGFNGQNFTFNGYLPILPFERTKKIKHLENLSASTTQLFMETPFRNQKLFEEILKTCNDETRLCVACDLTLSTEFIKTQKIKDWKKNAPELNKRYCIFLFG